MEDDDESLLRGIGCCLAPSRCYRVADAAAARDVAGEARGLVRDVVGGLQMLVVPCGGEINSLHAGVRCERKRHE